ncbi:MAG: tetratricopeptide repeat protein [Candidatus Wildermuthbacteria bacterium]|nr:tetratricopeptide repeat protein [Candidatus Wildermuthbacteria bacterium]
MKAAVFFDRLPRGIVYLLTLLLPLWSLPFTQDMLEYQKQIVLVGLAFLGVVLWFIRAIQKRKVQFRLNFLHIPVLLLLVAVGISTVFSLFPSGSFWGLPLDVAEGLFSFLAFFFLYFLLVQSISEQKQLAILLFILLLSVGIAMVFAMLQFFHIFALPFSFAQNPLFNTIGLLSIGALVAAILTPLALALAFHFQSRMRWLFLGISFVLFAGVALVNLFAAWVVLSIGLVLLLGFGMMDVRKHAGFEWISFPIAFLIVALFFAIFHFSIPGIPSIPREPVLAQKYGIEIAQSALKEHMLFGSGPGTFVYDYSQFHSPEVNKKVFWGLRLTSGASEVLDWVTTKGVVGGATLLFLFVAVLWVGIRKLIASSGGDSWMMTLGVFSSFTALIVAQFLYPANFLLWFLFWILLASFAWLTSRGEWTLSFSSSPVLSPIFSFFFLFVAIFGFGLLFITGQQYRAEILYAKGLQEARDMNIEKAISYVAKAASLNASQDNYLRDLAQLYLSRINQIAANSDLSADEKQRQINAALEKATDATRNAVEKVPANVANWNVRGYLFRNILSIQNADIFAIESYERAKKLEPSSPYSWTELARVYILAAQQMSSDKKLEEQRNTYLANAVENLRKAIDLESSYASAHYLLAVALDQQGKSDEAIASLEQARTSDPNDIGIVFQLGVAYWKKGEFEKARATFERAKGINADYANARYMLGLVYDRLGQKDKAREEFSAVAQSNPDNQEVKKILQNLSIGRPALDGIARQEQPPIVENPPEIQKSKESSESR